nr:hypothetical protein [Paenibacillus sp. JNUCC-31]
MMANLGCGVCDPSLSVNPRYAEVAAAGSKSRTILEQAE